MINKFREAIYQIKNALLLLVYLTILTGLIYPGMITAIGQLFFPWQSNGSLIKQDGQVVGSLLIGQSFTDPKYFYSRPSATTPYPYNGESSSGSNLGPSNPSLLAIVKERSLNLQKINPSNTLIPVDLVTTSASGLDPDISPLAAFYQLSRIAKLRKLSETTIKDLIQQSIQKRTLGIFGEPRINVLQLNIALDHLTLRSINVKTKT